MRIAITNETGKVTYADFVSSQPEVQAVDTTTTNATASFAETLRDSAKGIHDELSSSTTLSDIFYEASQTYGVSYNLLTAVAMQESNFQTGVTSASGAMGVMQLMPVAASYLGVNNAYDAYENIMGGAKLLAENLQKYNGSVDLALAAYNAGEGAVKAAGGVPASAAGYVQSVKSFMQQGVTVPDVVYKAADTAKADVAANVEKLLSEFAGHESYDRFVELMQQQAAEQIDAAERAKESGNEDEAQKAYRDMLASASVVIKQMIDEKNAESETTTA